MLIHNMLEINAKYYPRQVSIQDRNAKITWLELEERTNRLADSLLKIGLSKGDRLAILAPNGLYYWELCFTLSKSGIIGVPLNIRLNSVELSQYLNYLKPRAIVIHSCMVEVAKDVVARVPSIEFQIGLMGVDSLPYKYEELIDSGKSDQVDRGITENDIYMLGSTSGTTGIAKAAMHTHRTTISGIMMWLAEGYDVRPGDKHLQSISMFFNGGGPQMMYPFMKAGTAVDIGPIFDPVTFMEMVQEFKITHTILPPALLNMIVHHPDVEKYNLTSIRKIMNGGGPLNAPLLRRGRELFGDVFMPVYGLVESYATGIMLKQQDQVSDGPEDLVRRLGSIGKPMVGMQVKVVDEEGKEVPWGSGDTGEIVMKGASLAVGYWESPEKTRETFENGWLRTGDLAQIDKDGFMYITDRKNDVINSGNLKVYSVEVEAVLHNHPAVMQAAVIGIPDQKWGEAVKAYIVFKPGQKASAEEINEFCTVNLSSFKKPRFYQFVNSLPLSATGKVLKRVLREQNR